MKIKNGKLHQLIKKNKEILQKHSNEFIRAISGFFITILLSDIEWLERHVSPPNILKKYKNVLSLRPDSVFLHHILSRYYLEKIKRRKYMFSNIEVMVDNAVMNFIKLKDYSTPLNIYGTVIMRLVESKKLDLAEKLLKKLENFASPARELVLARIYGEVSVRFIKIGEIEKSTTYLRKAVNIFEKIGYKEDIISIMDSIIKNMPTNNTDFLLSRFLNMITDAELKLKFLLKALKIQDAGKKDVIINKTEREIINISKNYLDLYISEIIHNMRYLVSSKISERIIKVMQSKTSFPEPLLMSYKLEKVLLTVDAKNINSLIDIMIEHVEKLVDFELYSYAADYLVRVIEKIQQTEETRIIRMLCELAVLYYQYSTELDKAYECLGKVARILANISVDESISLIDTVRRWHNLSSLIVVNKLYKPVIEIFVSKNKGIKYFLERVEEYRKMGQFNLAAYLLTTIIEVLVERGELSAISELVDILASMPNAPLLVTGIIDKLAKKHELMKIIELIERLKKKGVNIELMIKEAIKSLAINGFFNEASYVLKTYNDDLSEYAIIDILAEMSKLAFELGKTELGIQLTIDLLKRLITKKGYYNALNAIAIMTAMIDDINKVFYITDIVLDVVLDLIKSDKK